MIELRWKKATPSFYCKPIMIGRTQNGQGEYAVLQYRESTPAYSEGGTQIHQGWDD